MYTCIVKTNLRMRQIDREDHATRSFRLHGMRSITMRPYPSLWICRIVPLTCKMGIRVCVRARFMVSDSKFQLSQNFTTVFGEDLDDSVGVCV